MKKILSSNFRTSSFVNVSVFPIVFKCRVYPFFILSLKFPFILGKKEAIHVNHMHELLTKIYSQNKTESANIIKIKRRFNYEILHSQLTTEQQYIIKSLKNIILTSNKTLQLR